MKTNQEAKQEAIKKAWGKELHEIIVNELSSFHEYKWSLFDFLNKGYCYRNFLSEETLRLFKWTDFYILNGNIYSNKIGEKLMHNNGWIRIEPDGSNLPESGEYRWLFESGSMSNFYYEPGDIMSTKLTHYKQITPELKPIY